MATKILRSVNLSNKHLISWRNVRFPNFRRLTAPISFECTVRPDRRLSARSGNFVATYAQGVKFLHGGAPPANEITTQLSDVDYNKIADETLESLADTLEALADSPGVGAEFDVSFSNGVITLKLSSSLGSYVINKQSPNKQLWLSSPRSGPKRYDFVNGTWIYKYEGRSLHELLTQEICDVLHTDIDLTTCDHGRSTS